MEEKDLTLGILEWVKVTDKLPEINKEIYFTDGSNPYKGIFSIIQDNGFGFIAMKTTDLDFGHTFIQGDITHWMYMCAITSRQ